jgi:hypothetical protein
MKLYTFYNDLLVEGRYFSEEKYNFIIDNLGDMLFNKLSIEPKLVQSLPEIFRFKSYLKKYIPNPIINDEDIVYNLSEYGEWLKYFSDSEFSKIVNGIFTLFPDIKKNVNDFNKPKRDPNLPPSRRGRPLGSKSTPKPIQFSRVISRTKPEPKDMVIGSNEPVSTKEPKPTLYLGPEDSLRKRGRKPIDDGLTSMERIKYKAEGPEMIEKLEKKIIDIDNETNRQIDIATQRIKKIMKDIEKRKNYFGLTD